MLLRKKVVQLFLVEWGAKKQKLETVKNGEN